MLDKVRNDIIYFLEKDHREFESYVWDLFLRPEVQLCSEIRHHNIYNRLEHMILVSKLAMYIAKRLGADPKTCARAGMIHDVRQYGQGFKFSGGKYLNTEKNKKYAVDIGEARQVIDAVASHHFSPWPKTREAYIVVLADVFSSVIETGAYLRDWIRRLVGSAASEFPHNTF